MGLDFPVTYSLYIVQTSRGTFLNFAAPAPERMASIRACLASAGLPVAVAEDLGAAADS